MKKGSYFNRINFGGPRLLNTIDLQKYHTKMLQMTDDVQQKLVKLTVSITYL